MQQPGLAGLGSGLPLPPSPAGPRQLKLCDREQQAREKDRVGAMGTATHGEISMTL